MFEIWDKSSEYQAWVKLRSGLPSPGVLMSVIVHYSVKVASLRTHITYLILGRNSNSDSGKKCAQIEFSSHKVFFSLSFSVISSYNTKLGNWLLLHKSMSL